MNSFKLASRSLLRKGRGNVIKIVSLGLGLAVGLVLVTKVFFEYNYESFYPDAERVYRLTADFTQGTGENKREMRGHRQTPGGVAPGMADELPQVEAATRYTFIGSALKLPGSGEVVDASIILADSCFYDVLPRPMVAGNAKEALSTPRTAIVSRSLAETLGAEVGQVVEFDNYPDRSVTIGAIFEDIPENSDFRYDMAISLLSISDFIWDGSRGWDGNDRYISFVKLAPGVTAAEMKPLMRTVMERHVDMEMMRSAQVDINYWLMPLLRVHSDDDGIRQSNLLMLLLAVSLISIALLNYLLITLSTVIGRAREIATYKCYGASGGDIRRQVLAESTLHIGLSLAAAGVLVGAFVDQIQEILRTSLVALVSWQSVTIVTGICALVLIVTTWVPSRLFANIPAASAFRKFSRSGKSWKLALLGVQFAYAAAFMAILVVIWRQYTMMVSSDPGYRYENVVYANVAGTPQSQRTVAIESLRSMAGVEMVAVGDELPFTGRSGNNISLIGDDRELFNVVDLYQVDENWTRLLDIPVIEGRAFERGVNDPTGDSEMMVDRRFAERITEIAGWTDGVVGKTVEMSEHGERTIVGVYENFTIGSAKWAEGRPSVLGYSEEFETYDMDYIVVLLQEVDSESLRAVRQVLESAMPGKSIRVDAMKNTITDMYDDERIERNSIVLCSVITLLVVLLGLVGYLRNEITRRSAEIAIRKINGATIADVLRLLLRDVLWVSAPSLAAGSFIAYYVSSRWIAGFAEQIALTPWLYLLSAGGVLAVIVGVAVATSYRISVQNPVDSLQKDS
ncbi:MAG: ABC transporter permease [Alistipes sp.]|jgi:putative ABC transport system permease protein|nr:ABC transporter permease [Alistipes sp.]